MAPRQVLIHTSALTRVADRLDALSRDLARDLGHELDVVLWSPEGVTTADGGSLAPEAVRPEAAWLSIDVLATGALGSMTDTIVTSGSCRWVQGPLAGVDAPPFAKIQEAGIRLSNSDAPNIGVAEYTMSALLAVVHGWARRFDSHRDRTWRQSQWREIGGMTWVIVGFGSIGHEIARRARPFGVEVIGVRRTAVTDPEADRMATMDQLHDELAGADAVVLACPLTEETKGLADEAFFGAMKPGAILVNVARGAVVNSPDLLSALDGGTPGTAILDVFETEPLPPDDPLWEHPSIVLTSHVAGAGAGITPRGDQLFIDQLDNYLRDTPLRLEVMR